MYTFDCFYLDENGIQNKVEKCIRNNSFEWSQIEKSFNNQKIQEWRIHNKKNPAFILYDNNFVYKKEWFENGFNNRLDGPAEIYCQDDRFYFWINGVPFNTINFANKTDHLICEYCYNFCKQKCFF